MGNLIGTYSISFDTSWDNTELKGCKTFEFGEWVLSRLHVSIFTTNQKPKKKKFFSSLMPQWKWL